MRTPPLMPPLPLGKRGRENAGSYPQSTAASATGRAPPPQSRYDARALADDDAPRRAKRGVTFSESTVDSSNSTLSELTDSQCQKVGDLNVVQWKINPEHPAFEPGILFPPYISNLSLKTDSK